MNNRWSVRMLVVICTVLTLITVTDAYAHERRMVGNYQFVVGWAEEPAIGGFKNSVQLILQDASGQPVLDLGDALRVEVTFGDQKYGPVPLEPAFGPTFGRPGDYRTPLIPTRAGAYSFHFTGTIRGTQVDQTFTASERTFAVVADPTEVEFPARDPSRAELAQRVERLSGRLDSAQTTARTATGLGVLGVLIGGIALALARRKGRGPTRV